MDSENPSTSQAGSTKKGSATFELHVPDAHNRRVFVGKFGTTHGLNLAKWKETPPSLARNLLGPDETPAHKTSKGQASDEAQADPSKNPADFPAKPSIHPRIPWILTDNSSDEKKKYRGTSEGTGLSDQSAYWVFTKKGDNFEAYPVSEWVRFDRIPNPNPTVTPASTQRNLKTLAKFDQHVKRKLGQQDESMVQDLPDKKSKKNTKH